MGRIANVQKVRADVGGRMITFRSKLEYRWAVWCQFRKELGHIIDWWYEDTPVMLETRIYKNKKVYIPDFTIENLNGEYEFEETKGFFSQKDKGKMKLAAQQYENPITLIFKNLPANSKNSKTRAQYNRAKEVEPFMKRVIYNAHRDIFKPIKHLFQL